MSKIKNLPEVGSAVKCSEQHKGTLSGYFTATDDRFGGTHLYGVIDLYEGYWATIDNDPHGTFVRMLVVHADNLQTIV